MKTKDKEITLKDFLAAEDSAQLVGKLDYESGLALLEELVAAVEAGDLSLEKSVLSYERGMLLLSHLQKMLSAAEEKLKTINIGKK